jgi:hypothetical protein
MKVPARVQYLVVVVLALAAIAFALPAMRDTPIEKFVRGECYWHGKGGSPNCQVPPQERLLHSN